MELIERTDVDEVVEAWVRAELESSRFGGRLHELFAADGRDRTALDDLTYRLTLLTAMRGQDRPAGAESAHIEGLPLDRIEWWRAEISRAELLEVRYIDWDYWLEVTDGSRRPWDFVQRLRDAGRGDPMRQRVDDVMADIENGTALPKMILVDSGPGTRIVVTEGHLRLTAYVMAGSAAPDRLAVLLGRAPLIADWSDY